MKITPDEKELLISIYNKEILQLEKRIMEIENDKKYIFNNAFHNDLLPKLIPKLQNERMLMVQRMNRLSGKERIIEQSNIIDCDKLLAKVDNQMENRFSKKPPTS